MNRRDLQVEDWIINPDDKNAYTSCDPKEFRRWVLKSALMRSLVDSATVVPRDYFHRLYGGHDLKEWRVLVGRTHFKELRHAFATWGVGWDEMSRSLDYGLIQASWVLGTAIVSAVCIPGGDPEVHFFPAIRNYNRNVGEPLVEIPYGALSLPDVFAHRKLGFGQAEPFVWFFTPDPVSPIAGEMRKAYEDLDLLRGGHDLSSTQS
jgi:hypothetical protein